MFKCLRKSGLVRYQMIIWDQDILAILKILNRHLVATSNYPNDLRIGYCAWKDNPNCMYLSIRVDPNMMRTIVHEMTQEKIINWYFDM